MTTRAEQLAATRQVLLTKARLLFAERGFADVGLAELVANAGVTKGALYHHFPDGKTELFAAVLGEVHDEVAGAVATAAEGSRSQWRRLQLGCAAFLRAATAADRQRIMLLDGPAVLGWSAWRELDEQASARHLEQQLGALMAAGELDTAPVAPLARLLSGAMNETALWIAAAGSRTTMRTRLAAGTDALGRLLDGLRRSPARRR